MHITGLSALLILIADLYAVMMIAQSPTRTIERLIWALVVLFLPLIGLFIWYLAGPGRKPF